MDPSHPAFNIDWAISSVNREHAAQNREWFSSYTPFASEVVTILGKHIPVEGIGTVYLPLQTQREKDTGKKTKNKKKSGGPSSSASQMTPSSSVAQPTPDSSILILHEVLFIPELSYNVVSAVKLDTSELYDIEGMLPTATIKDTKTGLNVGFTELTAFMPKFRLPGQARMVTKFDATKRPDTFDWRQKEMRRWEKTKGNSKVDDSSTAKVAEDEDDGWESDSDETDDARFEEMMNKLRTFRDDIDGDPYYESD